MGKQKNFFVCQDKNRKIDGYITVDTLESIACEIGSIGIFIYHSSNDIDLLTYRFFTMLKDNRPSAILYVNNEINYTLVSVFEALNADIYKTEDVINDKNTLKYCLLKYNKSPLALRNSDGDVQRLTQFINDISGDTSKALQYVNNPMWLAALNKSVQRVSTELKRYELATGQMVTVVQNIDETVQGLERNISSQQQDIMKLAKDLQTVENKYKEATVLSKQAEVNTMANELLPNKNVLSSFPPYTAKPSIPYTAYIQVKKNCPYLLSFLLSYIQTMKIQKKKNIKMLLLLPKSKTWIKYHDVFKVINAEYLKFGSNEPLDSALSTYWTAEPTSNFWNYVFKEQHNVDGFIVVDYIMDEPLLLGSKVTYMKAGLGRNFVNIEGKSDIPLEHTIFSIHGQQGGIILETIPDYTTLEKDNVKVSRYHTLYRNTAFVTFSNILHLT